MRFRNIFRTTGHPALLPRIVVGAIFLSEGLQKFITPDATGAGRFAKLGFDHPQFWALLTGGFEIACAILILLGLLTRLAAVPLFIIMMIAFLTTKLPTLKQHSLWTFAHEYRTDFAMTILLLFLLRYGGGALSVDGIYMKKSSGHGVQRKPLEENLRRW